MLGTFLIGSVILMGIKKKYFPKVTFKKEMLSLKKKQKNLADNKTKLSVLTIGTIALSYMIPVLYPVNIALLFYLSLPIFKSTWLEWNNKKIIGHNMLVSLLFGIGILSGQLFSLALALFFYHLSKNLLAKTQNHSKSMLSDLFNQRIEKAWVLRDSIEIEVPLETISKNDYVVVNTGDMIPIDGVVTEGAALIDQQMLTGESQPVEKLSNSQVFASTQVISGRIIILVQQTGTETTGAKIGEILNHTTDYKMNLLTEGEKHANKLALPLIALSFIITPFLGIIAMTGVLNSTFGNRLQLIAPLSVLNHLNIALKKGILIKDGRALESLSKIDTILFDKTGTLTTDNPTIGSIVCTDDYQIEQLLAEAAAAESKLSHPIAKAIVTKAKALELIIPTINDTDFKIGLGVSVKINNRLIQVGSLRFMQQAAIEIPNSMKIMMASSHEKGHSVIFVAAENQLKGLIEIQPSIRPEIEEMIIKLRQQGIKHLAIVSGDHEYPTKKLAEHLNMDDYFFDVLPEDKAKIVSRLQEQGRKVCFIGDGINDSIAIKKADVSISIEGATTIAQDLAQIVFMDGSLKYLPDLFDIASSLDENLTNTVKTLYLPVLINLSGALFFGFGLMATVIINNASLLLALKETKQHDLE
jgi:Cu2+-exporting ATPase